MSKFYSYFFFLKCTRKNRTRKWHCDMRFCRWKRGPIDAGRKWAPGAAARVRKGRGQVTRTSDDPAAAQVNGGRPGGPGKQVLRGAARQARLIASGVDEGAARQECGLEGPGSPRGGRGCGHGMRGAGCVCGVARVRRSRGAGPRGTKLLTKSSRARFTRGAGARRGGTE